MNCIWARSPKFNFAKLSLNLQILTLSKFPISSLGPIVDIPVIISTICFRHHNLCKKCQNFTKFSHTEKPVSFHCALSLNAQHGTFVTSPSIFFIVSENKMATRKILTYCSRTPGKHIFAHSPLFKQHLALTMAIAMCLCQSAASPKHQNVGKCLGHSTFLASLPQWVGHSQLASAPTQWGKDISLRAIA